MPATIKILPLILIAMISRAQVDTLPHLNARGKKEGFWPVYLDSNTLVTDSAKAAFVALAYYSNGKNLSDFFSARWKKRDSVVFMGSYPDSGIVAVLNGKFTWYDKKSQMITYEEAYANGKPHKFKMVEYKKKRGIYTWAFIRNSDFTKRYRGLPGSYYITEQNNQAIYNIPEWAKFWFRPGKRGWKKYRI